MHSSREGFATRAQFFSEKRISANGRIFARRIHRADGAAEVGREKILTYSIEIRAARARAQAAASPLTTRQRELERRPTDRLCVRRRSTALSVSNQPLDC